jgi:hypothetical protein
MRLSHGGTEEAAEEEDNCPHPVFHAAALLQLFIRTLIFEIKIIWSER